jgi:type II secretory pathway predicted ATPase ExeA
MGNFSRLETFVGLGFKHDPFKRFNFKTADSTRIGQIIEYAVSSRAMVSIVGIRGDGKSRAVRAALDRKELQIVFLRSPDKARLLITDVEQAIIFELSDDKPKRGREIRSRQLRPILGQASRRREVVLVIEEAHQLHGMTLRALKSLREIDWMGETELFTVVLIGQGDPMNKAGVAEVRLRADTVRMQGLTMPEVAGYVKGTVGRVFSSEAIDAVKQLPNVGNYLNLQEVLVSLMGHALMCGRNMVQVEDLKDLYGEKVVAVKPDPGKKAGKLPGAKVDGEKVLQKVMNKQAQESGNERMRAAG